MFHNFCLNTRAFDKILRFLDFRSRNLELYIKYGENISHIMFNENAYKYVYF